MRRLYILALAAIVNVQSIKAQVDLSEPDRIHCGTAVINNQRLAQNPALQAITDEIFRKAKESTPSNKSGVISFTIPVVYHVIHDNGPENVSKAVIEQSIANLNEDFQKLNADLSQAVSAFAGIAADCEIRFRLAHLDPNNQCTEGITRTQSPLTFSAGENVKALIGWDTRKYLNVWVVHTLSSGAGGYSYYPGFAPSQQAEGIVIRSAQLGNSLTHEVGHYLALPHLWGNSNNPGVGSNCSIDDGIGDTPVTIGNTSCNLSSITCGTLDNVQNYMEYSFCEVMFTEGQKTVMHAALNSSMGWRNNLWTTANLNATGTNDPYGPVLCAPIADFTYNKEYICEGSSVSFSDNSYNAVPTAWIWTFTGGSPGGSTASNPTITYNNAGVYNVTYQPSTSAGSDNITKNGIITVSSLTADYTGNVVDGFENTTLFNNDWRIENPEGFTWENNTTAQATGGRSVRIRNFFTNTDGLEDELISPSYDISSVSNKQMTFKQAFAKKTSADTDKLLVFWSINCGESWVLRLPMSASGNLATTSGNVTGVYIPTGSDWVERTVDLTPIANETNVRFKFEFTSGGGNDIYLDDINIGGPVGIEEQSLIGSFKVFPNPTNANAKVSFNLLSEVNNLSITVKNALGQVATKVINSQSFNAGSYTLNIDEERKLSSGIYFIEFNADNVIKTQKLIIQ